jgi:hypothetical protein
LIKSMPILKKTGKRSREVACNIPTDMTDHNMSLISKKN